MTTQTQRIQEILNQIKIAREELASDDLKNILSPLSLYDKIQSFSSDLSQYEIDIARQKNIAERKKTIVFFGKFSTGKTTVIQSLLSTKGFSILELPKQDDPTTAKPVRITFSEELSENEIRAIFLYEDGKEEVETDVGKIFEAIVTSEENSANSMQEITIETAHPLLIDFDLLDLPGTGTAYYKSHEKIVNSRLRDGSVIIWTAGGPDTIHPGDERDTLRELVDEGVRQVIPVWNCAQKKGTMLEHDAGKKNWQEKAEAEGQKFENETEGIAGCKPIKLWAEDALLDRTEGWEGRTGMQPLFETIEKTISEASDSSEIASKSLEELKLRARDATRNSVGCLRESQENIGGEKSDMVKALRHLDYAVYDSIDDIKDAAEELGDEIANQQLYPVIRDFVQAETSTGGVVKTAVEELVNTIKGLGGGELLKKLKNFFTSLNKNIEEAVKKRLDEHLSMNENMEWFKLAISQTCENVTNKLNRKWTLFAQENTTQNSNDPTRLDLNSDSDTSSPQETLDNLAKNLKHEVEKNILKLTGTLAALIAAIIVAALPKTGTAIDIVVLVGTTIIAGFILSALRKRMLSRVRLAAYECNIAIRQEIRKPLKDAVQKIEDFWTGNLNLGITDSKLKKHNAVISTLISIVNKLTHIDV